MAGAGTGLNEVDSNPNTWTLPIREARPPSKTAHLCLVCDRLWEKIVWPTPNGTSADKTFPVGWLDRMIPSTDCAFCHFFTRIYLRPGELPPRFTPQCRVLCCSNFESTSSDLNGMRTEWILCVKYQPFDANAWNEAESEFINVMMIRWHDGMATRAGLGQIHSDAWTMVKIEDKDIILG